MEERSGVVKQSDKDVSKITATITSTVTQRTSTSVVETEGKPGQIILKESKIGEPILGSTEEERSNNGQKSLRMVKSSW